MKRTIDLDQIRVVAADNYKGSPRLYLEIMDTRVLYSDPGQVRHWLQDSSGAKIDTEIIADLFRFRLARILAKLLLENGPDLAEAWSTETDREIDYVKPRLDEDPDE